MGDGDDSLDGFRRFAGASNDAILLVRDELIVDANDRAQDTFGYGEDDLRAMTLGSLLDQGGPQGEKASVFETVGRRKNGTAFRAAVSSRPVPGAARQRQLLVRDADSDFLARARELEYREFFQANSDAVFVHDVEGRIILVNERMCALFGCTPDEALTLTIADLSSDEAPFTQQEAMKRLEEATRQGPSVFEWKSRKRNGEVFWSEVGLKAFETGGKRRFIACVRDISARKEMEHALKASEERFAKIFRSASLMLAFTEPREGRIIDVNDTWTRESGVSREAAIGKTGRELGLWTSLADREAILKEFAENGRVRDREAVLVMRSRPLHTLISIDEVDLRGQRYLLWEIRDVSERKRAEAAQDELRRQLLQAHKMESIGRLAGGVAHDFNNLLTVINGSAELLLQRAAIGDRDRIDLLDIRTAGQRAAALTRQLLAFSRQQVMQRRLLNLNHVVSEAETLFRRVIGEDLELSTRLAPSLHGVLADQDQITQVLMNLVVNARDAMPRGGRLTLETSDVQIAEDDPGIPVEGRAGSFVALSVTDTGTGMDAETQSRIFEPFFTSKPRGTGTGLGLPTVYGIVKQSGGWISVQSEPGRGSTFTIYLPSAAGQPGEKPELPPEDLEPRGTETLLVVEDQPDVRSFMVRALGPMGYRVLEAESGEEALKVSAEHEGPIHAIVTDVVLAGMSGRDLAERLKEIRPEACVLYVSGYTNNIVAHHGVHDEGLFFLQKPFTPATLGRKLREALEARLRRGRHD